MVRNRVRRRLREAYRLHETRFRDGLILVIVAHPESATATYAELLAELLRLSARMGLLEDGDQ